MNSQLDGLYDSRLLRWQQFRNNAGETIPAGGIVRITGIEERNLRQCLIVAKPNTFGSQYLHAVNGPVDVPSGGYGYCTQSAGVAAYYDSADGTPAFGEAWGPRDATWKLKKNTGGFLCLGNADTTNFLVQVLPNPMLSFVGKTDATHNKAASGTISIYTGATVGSETDTTVNMTSVYNRFANLAASKWVRCEWNNWSNTWEIVAAEC